MTLKQKKVVASALENLWSKSKWEILAEAWYWPWIVKNPSIVFGSKSIVEAFKQAGITDSYLVGKHKEHLNARTICKKDTSYKRTEYKKDPNKIRAKIQKELDEDMPWARIVSFVECWVWWMNVQVRFSMPDYMIQWQALDKAYKILWAYAPEKEPAWLNLQINNIVWMTVEVVKVDKPSE